MIRNKVKKRKIISPAGQRKRRANAKRGKSIAKILALLTIIFFVYFIYMSSDKICKEFYQMTASLGFVVKDVTVEGQRHISDDQISKVLKIKTGAPIFSVSLADIKARLEGIEWVKYVIVERVLPDKIYVCVVERTPIALGQKDHKLYIIDDEGAIVNEKNIKEYIHLPIIIGDGAEIYASSLIKMLKIEPSLFKSIVSIIRVSERRWNIRFENGLEVKFPEEGLENAWNTVIKLYKKKELFEMDIKSLDLRVPNKIFVEKK